MTVVVAVCASCGRAAFPPRVLCPRCGGAAWHPGEHELGVVTEVTEYGGARFATVLTDDQVHLVVRIDSELVPGSAVTVHDAAGLSAQGVDAAPST